LEPPFRQGETRTESGALAAIAGTTPAPAVLASGPGYAAAFAYGKVDLVLPQLDAGSSVTAQFNSSGQLTLALDGSGSTYRLDGTHADFGTDGILAWGRWIGQVLPVAGLQNYSDNQGLHYVIGTPSATLPTTGTATYTLAGATRPTYTSGA